MCLIFIFWKLSEIYILTIRELVFILSKTVCLLRLDRWMMKHSNDSWTDRKNTTNNLSTFANSMRRCWQENHYLICPHTAVAVWYHYNRAVTAGVNRCCIATASPAKFQEAVHRAGLTLDLPEEVLALETMKTRYKPLEKSDDWETKLRQHIELIGSVRDRGETFYPK